MAVFQAALSFELFTGLRPDRERMLRHFATLAEEVTALAAEPERR
jgi:shikimate dehydrogenase